jgi:hypothetical protein
LQGAVEALYLSVLPWAVRPDEQVPGVECGEGVADGVCAGVADVVVGHHLLDAGDAEGGEGLGCAEQEGRAGGAFLVGEDFGVGQAGVVVDQGVDVVEPDPGPFLCPGLAVFAAVRLPSAAVVDPADLLHVHVHQLAGPAAFVADRGGLGGADHLAGQWVAVAQVRDLVAAQDA